MLKSTFKYCFIFSVLLEYVINKIGSVPEWLKGADCKSATFRYVGSNPTRPIFNQSVRFLLI